MMMMMIYRYAVGKICTLSVCFVILALYSCFLCKRLDWIGHHHLDILIEHEYSSYIFSKTDMVLSGS